MKKAKRLLCVVLIALMLCSTFVITPISVSAYATGDDYPAKYKSPAIDSVVDEWNFYNRECTSFVAWCLNSRNGVGFTNWYGGVRWGNADNWGKAARSVGITVDSNPAVGSVAWTTSCHVAWVKEVNGNTIKIDEYNWNGDGKYHERTLNKNTFSGYIHIKDISNPVVTVNNPIGVVDIIESKSPGKVRVRGWVFDLDNPTASLDVHVYIGGGAGTPNAEGHPNIKANQSRHDVAKAYASHNVGEYHGFDATISTSKSGSQPVYIYGINIGGGGNVCIGSGTVDIPIYNPTCCLDMVKSDSAGTVFVRGWAFDKDDLSKSIDIHVYIGGVASDKNAEGHVITANVEGKDVNKIYGCGDYHRFSATIKTKKTGTQDVHLYGINIGSGGNVYIGKGTVDIKPVYNPYGYLDVAKSEEPGTLYVKGWAFDKDDVNATVDVQIYVGGPADSGAPCYVVKANKNRTDVNKVFAGVGDYHGYEETIKISKFGEQAIYAYAINIGSTGENSQLVQSPKTVNILQKNQPVTDNPTEQIETHPTTGLPTEPTSTELTQPTSDKPTEPTETPTDAPTQVPTAEPTETTTQAPTETVSPTEAPTTDSTQPASSEPTSPTVTDPTQPTAETPTQSATEAPKTTSKKPNPIKVSVKKKTVKLKKLKKKAQKVKAITVKNAQGKVTYKLVAKGITKSIRKLVKINSKGVITIKRWKKAKTGDYKIKLKITAKGNKGYNKKTVTKTVKIRIE